MDGALGVGTGKSSAQSSATCAPEVLIEVAYCSQNFKEKRNGVLFSSKTAKALTTADVPIVLDKESHFRDCLARRILVI